MEQRLADARNAAIHEAEMPPNPFWTAFLSGLAAPTSLYAPPAPYEAFTTPLGAAESMAMVGVYLSGAVSVVENERTEEALTDA
jgi:hypothetical protein